MRYPRNQVQQPMYYPRGGGGAKTAAIVLGILCGVLFIALLAVSFQLTGKNDNLIEKINAINEKNQEIDELKLTIAHKREVEYSSYITGTPEGPVDKDWKKWYEKCKQLEIDLAAEVQQSQFYKNLVPQKDLEKAELVYVGEADLKLGTDTMTLTLTLVNKTNTALNNVTGKVRFFNNELIVKEIPFTAPVLEANSETPFELPPIPRMDHSHYHVELLAGNRPYKRQ